MKEEGPHLTSAILKFHERGASAISKQDAAASIAVIGHAGQHIRTTDEYAPNAARINQSGTHAQGVQKTCTTRSYVESPGTRGTQLRLDDRRNTGELLICSSSGNDDKVELIGFHTSASEGIEAS